jgi:Skp family chaperone for outer membrane proteins
MSAKKLFSLTCLCSAWLSAAQAQSPAPVLVVPAANQAAPVAPVATNANLPATPDSSAEAIKVLEQMKATNAETLKKQEETLQRLDELQKAVEQLKIYSKRS